MPAGALYSTTSTDIEKMENRAGTDEEILLADGYYVVDPLLGLILNNAPFELNKLIN